MTQRATGWEQRERRKLRYTPVMQFYLRMIRTALFEATRVKGDAPYGQGDGVPENTLRVWDEAIMARLWLASGAPSPAVDREGYLLSFDAACAALGLDADHERVWMLEKVDAEADFDTDAIDARTAYLTANPPDAYEEPLFDAPRVVPALDQGNLFAMLEAA